MARKKVEWYDIDEASVASNVAGFQLPIGAKGKKKNNPSKPFGEPELFENKVVLSELEETIRQVDGEWVIIDPKTGAEVAKANTRDAARDKQAKLGITKQKTTHAVDGVEQAADVDSQPKKKKGASIAGWNTGGFEEVKRTLRKTLKEAGIPAADVSLTNVRKALSSASGVKLKEGSMLSYCFENSPPEQESLWESFIGKLKREHVMSDIGLSESLQAIAAAEAKVLARSVMEIKKILEGTQMFAVERCEADMDPQSGDIKMPFKVAILPADGEDAKDLLFGVKLEHGRPLVLFPESSRYALNNMVTKESKMLRAELMHVQETILDTFEEVVQASANRDTYLSEMQTRLGGVIESMNLVETSIMKNLIRKKLKGAK